MTIEKTLHDTLLDRRKDTRLWIQAIRVATNKKLI